MNKDKYLSDIKDIKDIMDRSTRFTSLSGLSGVSTGIIALVAAYLAYNTGYAVESTHEYADSYGSRWQDISSRLFLIAIVTFVLSIISGLFFTYSKAKRNRQKLWDKQAIRLFINLLIPLATGGILCIILYLKGYIGLIAPLTLIFYGLALVNASKYTLSEIRSLGLLEIILGLISTCYIGFGLIFWAIGFGVLHIIYGLLMNNKYGS